MSKKNRNRGVVQMSNNENNVDSNGDQKLEIKESPTIINVEGAGENAAEEDEEEVVVLVNNDMVSSPNPQVRQFAYQVNQYIALCSLNSVSEQTLYKKLQQFTMIIRAIINSTDTEVYNAAYRFFKEHRNDILSEQTVFQYVHKLPTELSIRVQTVYTTMKELVAANVDHKPFRLDYGLIRDNMKLPAQHPFYNWIRKRLSH